MKRIRLQQLAFLSQAGIYVVLELTNYFKFQLPALQMISGVDGLLLCTQIERNKS